MLSNLGREVRVGRIRHFANRAMEALKRALGTAEESSKEGQFLNGLSAKEITKP